MRACGTPRIECATCDSVVSRPGQWLWAPIRNSSPPSGVKRASAGSWPGTIGMPHAA
jgi:hypothetical protein